MSLSPEDVVTALLTVAGLPMSDAEKGALVAAYPKLRESFDSLYEVPIPHEEESQLIFNPGLGPRS